MSQPKSDMGAREWVRSGRGDEGWSYFKPDVGRSRAVSVSANFGASAGASMGQFVHSMRADGEKVSANLVLVVSEIAAVSRAPTKVNERKT